MNSLNDTARTDVSGKWTAFVLSLAVPGCGQLYVGHLSCLPWFLAAGLLAAATLSVATSLGHAAMMLQAGWFVALGICSAEHAKRLCEHSPESNDRRGFGSRVFCRSRQGRTIHMKIEIDVPYGAPRLWAIVADLPRFLTIDPFHQRVTLMRAEPRAGVDLVLSHNAFGVRCRRFGRILRWQDGKSYAFSDLSRRGSRHGFPHAFFVSVEPVDDHPATLSRLTIEVRGKWTARLIPLSAGRLWLRWVCSEHARLLRKAL